MAALTIAAAARVSARQMQSPMSVTRVTEQWKAAAAAAEEAAVNDDNRTGRLPAIFKVLIPLFIILVIAGMYFWKNAAKEPAAENEPVTSAESAPKETYPLKITAVDLEAIKAYGVPTVVDFGSDSCVPCREMAPVLETLNAEWQGKAAVQFIDVWKYSDGVVDFPVQVIPTQVFFNADGTPFVPSESLQKQIEFTMYSDKDTGEHAFTLHQGGITEEQMRQIFAEMGVE